MSDKIHSGILEYLSDYIGTTEAALKLLFTVFASYPLAFLHRKYVYGKDKNLQHLFFAGTGFLLGFLNYGFDILHCVFAVIATYLMIITLKGPLSVAAPFAFNLGYLLIGYVRTSTNDYDINWTMPYCILVLRLIGISFDYYDGQQPFESLSAENKKVALKERPTLLEMLGHCFFPAAFIVGPQFPLKRYQDFVAGEFSDKEKPNQPPDCIEAGTKRLLIGLGYLIVFQVLGWIVSDEYLLTDEFYNLNFFKKMFLMGLWGRYTLYKYISCWLLSEGACILLGIAHNGTDDKGLVKWDGLANIKLSIFENCTEFNHYIMSFNINTNHWVAQYIYKRLKFLGNRHVSQLAALLFLAIWHGFHSGYYVCFFFEFVVMYMERDIKSIVNSNETLTDFFKSPLVVGALQVILRMYTFVFMGWCLMPFVLLKFDRYWYAFGNVSYCGIVLFVMWPLVYGPLIRLALKKIQSRKSRSE